MDQLTLFGLLARYRNADLLCPEGLESMVHLGLRGRMRFGFVLWVSCKELGPSGWSKRCGPVSHCSDGESDQGEHRKNGLGRTPPEFRTRG